MIADEACYERGCPMHDERVTPGVLTVATKELNPYRNMVLEEVAAEFDKMKAFGDTAESFAIFVRDMKK